MRTEKSTWLAEVDRILQRSYCIGHVDAGWSEEDIEKYLKYDMLPEEFVNWYAGKYDLTRIESFEMSRG